MHNYSLLDLSPIAEGQSEAVLVDFGGFLGIGTHTVAVPLEELQVFRDEGNNIRIYLPWTQAQLEALPEFDENNPASLDATEQAPATGGSETEPAEGTTGTNSGG